MSKYLSESGLSYLWGKIKSIFATKTELAGHPTGRIYYGTCSTTANTYVKEATVETFPLDANNKPLVGTVVAIKYSVTNTYKTEGQTYALNVNNTGEYPMYYNNAAVATSTSADTLVAGYKNRHVFYVFNGTQWVWLSSSYDANTTYSGMTQDEIDAGTSTTARLITPARLRNNFYTEGEVDELIESVQDMIVTISPDGNDGYVADKTFAEIKAFLDSGGNVIAKDEEDGDSYYYLDNYIASEVVFTRNIWGSGGFSTRYYTIDNTDSVSFIDALHSISSSVNSSSTTNIANSAAVKTVKDDLANYVKKDTGDNSAVYFRNHNGVISISGDGFIEIDPNEQGDVQGNGNVLIYGDVSIPETLTVDGERVAVVSDIPSAVTESTVSGWGFTKNTGTYSKPSSGIPKTDLASAVQTSLGLADTALQSYTETDPTVPSWAKAANKPTYTASEVGALPDTTVIPAAPGTLNTTATTAQSTSSSEALSGSITLHKVAKTGTYNDLIDKPTIPAAVTESTVSGWGFTKNTGTYTKPAGGIPASDIASGVIPTVPTALSSFTDDLGSSPTHTHSQYLTSAPVTSVNGQTGAVSLTIPTVPANVSAFTNDAGYTTNTGTVTSTGGTTAVNNIQVVAALPASPNANTLYLIPE